MKTIVATSSPLGEEAIGKVALHLAEGLSRAGLLERLLYRHGHPLPQSRERSSQLPQRHIPFIGRFGWGRSYLLRAQDRDYQARVVRELRSRPAGLFYCWVLQSLEPLETCRTLGIATALECGFIHPESFREVLARECERYGIPLPWHLSNARVNSSLRELTLADTIVAPSQLVAESFVARGWDAGRFLVMPPGVDCDFFQPRPDPQHKGPVALYVGRLELAKGVHHLIAAWDRIKRSGRRLMLVGSLHPCLKQWLSQNAHLVDESIVFAGVQPDLRPYFAEALVTVLPSLADGFGMAVMEGMAAGVPAVVTDGCGVTMAIRQGVNGWVVPRGDIAQLAHHVDLMLGEPQRAIEMGRQAAATARDYTWEIFERNAATAIKKRTHDR